MLRAASESATNMATTDRRALPTTPRGVGAAARDERESEGSLQPHLHASGVRPPPLPDPVEGRCLGGKLLVGERIGSGALGAVYRAKHVLLPQPIAVKVLHPHCRAEPTYRARFLAEAQSASMLDHPNLVRVVDFGEERGGLMWLAMELLDGRSIDTVQHDLEGGRFSVERAVAILLDVCAGLAHAHERGVVHGDVKPSNVVLVMHTSDDGEALERAKLCDFGVARFRAPSLAAERGDEVTETPSQRRMESGTQPSFHAAGAFGGTPAYMSPEQCVGDELDARSDVYSCGVLFHELITGEVPFSVVESNAGAVLRKHLLAPPTLPSAHRTNIDARIDAIVAKSLAKDPSDRFASMRELRAALRDLSCGLGLPMRASVAPMPVPTPAPTTTLTAIATAMISRPSRRQHRLSCLPRPTIFGRTVRVLGAGKGGHTKDAPTQTKPQLTFASRRKCARSRNTRRRCRVLRRAWRLRGDRAAPRQRRTSRTFSVHEQSYSIASSTR